MAAPTKPPQQQQQSIADATAPKRKRADTADGPSPGVGAGPATSTSTSTPEPSAKKIRLGESLHLSTPGEIAAANSVEDRYDVQVHSVISSSKIQNRVRAVLRHIDGHHENDANPSSAATSAKPKLSVLRAKAADAGKVIAIAEIAKRELEKPKRKQDGGGGEGEGEGAAAEGRWFQYIALGEEIKERPRDQSRQEKRKNKKKNSRAEEDTRMGDNRASDDDGNNDDDGDDDGDDDDGHFETMKTPFERAIEKQPLLRGTPAMSLFLSRVPIEELKKRYGEQTNASPS
ncbi:hypothetical protein SLS62_008389 [Diatrype stigma]|uniref:Uncharacterized protein n=1 Tax=Diatrype stigma TaxID=117547 RepID=A0AAN9YNS8_9PEZI